MNPTEPTDSIDLASAGDRSSRRRKDARLAWLFAGVAGLVLAAGMTGLLPWGPVNDAYAADDHALIGQPAPNVTVPTLNGKSMTVADAKGRVLVLDFWATWCPPCVKALPVLKSTVAEFEQAGHPVTLVAMNVQEDQRTIERFLKDQGLEGLTVGLDEGAAAQAYLVTGIPQSVVIEPTGKVTAVHVGFSPKLGDELKADIEAALKSAEEAS